MSETERDKGSIVVVTGAIHGNERTGVEAQLALLKSLGTDNPASREILQGVTLVAIPMLNPDGVELNRRINDVTWAETVADFPQLAAADPAWRAVSLDVGHDLMVTAPEAVVELVATVG